MRKPKLKALLMFVFIFSLALSACTSNNNNTSTDNSMTNQESEAAENTAVDNKANDSGEASDSEPVTETERLALNWFVHAPADSALPEGDQDFIRAAIQEKFNVDLSIQYMPIGADFESKLSLLMASGDTPDLFVSAGIASQKFILDGITADMTPFISPQTMPNYFKWVSEQELQRYAVENKFERAPLIFPREVYRSYYIRQDWLDKLQLKVPTNYEEMLEVMRAFTFDDPDGNNRDDTYGLTAVGNGTSVSWDFPEWIQSGLIGAFMIRDNHLVDIQSDVNVQHVLQGIKNVMKEGIVDPDWFLNKGAEHEDKAVGGKAGIIVGATKIYAMDSNPTSLQNKTKAIFPEANWTAFHPFAETGTWTENLPDTAFMFSRETAENSPEKIERIVHIMDWMAGEEGYLLINYGLEGKHYTREGSRITLTQEHLNALQKDVIEQGNFREVYRFIYGHNPEHEPLGLEVVDERMTDRDREIVKTIQSYKLIPSIGTNVAPPAGFNLADFRKIMREYQVKILFDEPDASNWPKYREELMTKHGGQQMIDVYEEQIRAAGVIQ